MNDARGGLLLFCFYGLGTFGSYYARGRMNRSIARGALLTLLGALALAWAGEWTAYGAIAIYGFGLSLTMTSISLLLSQRFPEARRVELTRLNLVWALGAALGPWIALRSTRGRSLRGYVITPESAMLHVEHVLLGVAIFFAVVAAWSRWMEQSAPLGARSPEPAAGRPAARQGDPARFGVPWPLLVLIFGSTGVEAAASGWLTSYAQRAGDSLGITIGAATFLWLGSLISRMVHSTAWASRLPERGVLGASMVAMTAALALLIAWPMGVVTIAAAAVLGLAAGPVYPLLLAAALRHRENSTGFVVAGVGASMVPLLTGTVSNWTHSLRAGLGIPLLAAVIMMVVVGAARSVLEGRTEAVTESLTC